MLIYFRYISILDCYLVGISVKANFSIKIRAKDISILLMSFFTFSALIMFYNSKISDSGICLYKVLEASMCISYEW